MPVTLNLTMRMIDDLPVPTDGKRKDYYDAHMRGLLVQVTPAGKKLSMYGARSGTTRSRYL